MIINSIQNRCALINQTKTGRKHRKYWQANKLKVLENKTKTLTKCDTPITTLKNRFYADAVCAKNKPLPEA